jgi:hypothetical protein
MLTEGIFDMRTPQPEWLWDRAGLTMRAGAALTSALGKGDSLSNEDFNNPGLQSASSAVSRTNAGTIATAHAATASSPINRSCDGRGADDASDDLPAQG